MNQFELSVCAEMLWPKKDIYWRISFLREMGFGVGLWNVEPESVSKYQATKANFTIMNGYTSGCLSDFGGSHQLLLSIENMIDTAKRLEVNLLNLHGTGLDDCGLPVIKYNLPETPKMWIQAVDTLKRICDLADREDVYFCLENLNTAYDHPNVPFAEASKTYELCEAVDHPRLKMNLDLYHMQIGEGDLLRNTMRFERQIGEIQVANVPGRLDPVNGEIDYKFIAKKLHEDGYRGNITMEAYTAPDGEEQALWNFRKIFTIKATQEEYASTTTERPESSKASKKVQS